MKTKLFSLACMAALSILSFSVIGCVATPPPGESGVIQGPSIEQKQIDRQEAISRQQRSLM